MSEVSEAQYQQLEQDFVKFKSLQTAQKQRGLNDFNVFTTLLSKTDEVRLHSRFIAALLDANGKHYQGSLFLESFLKYFKPDGFAFDAANSSCYREYNNIDIYLTDGSNHIIIENKIYAADQKDQAKRYIEIIRSENKDVDGSHIWFCYLTPNRTLPESYSLGKVEKGGFELSADGLRLVSKELEVFYSNVHYKTDVPVWLEDCLNEIGNLKDLSVVIQQYQSVVSKINGTYKSKVMELKEYLNTLADARKKDFLSTLITASKELEPLKQSMMDGFFEKLQERIASQKLPDGWNVLIDGGPRRLNEKWGFPFRIVKEGNNLLIGLEFNTNDYRNYTIGVVRISKSFDIKGFVQSLDSDERDRLSKNSRSTVWWLHYIDTKGSLWEKIVKEGEETVLQEIEIELMRLVTEYEWVCNKSAS